ncbi:MAG: hypothetical protein RMX96_28010 [Nostoc sp. ChiSLP02]|nr:hypothetical protein [Nostoc sp. DedSLP01]MDZ8188686.1 hypothetical protein [Nostoc sp. ChiSLP02]
MAAPTLLDERVNVDTAAVAFLTAWLLSTELLSTIRTNSYLAQG